MDRRRLTTIVLLLAALGLAVYTSPWVRRFFPSRVAVPTALRALVAPLTPPAPPALPPVLARADLEAWRQRTGDAWRRDPFFTAAEERAVPAVPAPPVAVTPPPAAAPSYTVKMVLISGGAKVAAIDGRIVGEGEMLGDERIVEIQPGGVVLERGGRRRLVEVMGGGAVPLIEVAPR